MIGTVIASPPMTDDEISRLNIRLLESEHYCWYYRKQCRHALEEKQTLIDRDEIVKMNKRIMCCIRHHDFYAKRARECRYQLGERKPVNMSFSIIMQRVKNRLMFRSAGQTKKPDISSILDGDVSTGPCGDWKAMNDYEAGDVSSMSDEK